MSNLSKFVIDRNQTASPHNGQSKVKVDRRAAAANAKIPMKNGLPLIQPKASSNLSARGYGNAQNSSATLQQPQRWQADQKHAQHRDAYDTDAASIDTTIDTSAVKIEEVQNVEQEDQPHGQVNDYAEDEEEEGEETGDDEQGTDEQGDEYSEDYHDFSREEEEFIARNRLEGIPREEQVHFLQQAHNGGYLLTVKGDSYPPTSDGATSEWEGGQGAPVDFHNDVLRSSPPRRPNINNQSTRMITPQQQQESNMAAPSHALITPQPIFKAGAHLREQSRSTPPVVQYGGPGYQHHTAVPPTSQLPTYSQANVNVPSEPPLHSNPRSNTHAQASRSQQSALRQSSGPSRAQVQVQFSNIPVAQLPPLGYQPFAPVKLEPVIQQPRLDEVPVEDVQTPDCDYDFEVLTKMKYDDLKNENFDTDPRARPRVLAEEENQKDLSARLKFVQRTLDVGQQAEFFNSLPSREWEEAGDWFLDQFQSIIQRTRQARQKKRKLAQEFETEVEKRHEHVSKKQHQVQQAMDRMKAQGEGLVPRSPRPSKSPRAKRS
ncbi:hypothetical protein PtrSN002B_001026 [Pyrenophora tritici-repentis]|uniref:ECM11 domain containing protein n=2 Tax=Pyrenophora tritici-repentis TaxID=45151 RepID=A0A2W1F2N9_9PLEO|nr:uncharacterized protein PTRG_11158 [Pyrenophora tritici-repentis Pt-1C-BFP]KAA8622286.1 ECM11 domain-containing protein [Pyrenophora tritici-repentis]EDU44208.1 predicted protein [Pyrenophora tritici-repentis Pt-1C-BFP]KAF7451263.1 hypothetical protein A1F99_030400 [Pyrenophora tritici-repentis]KAF7575626.1 hypothetical protein PtrM4_072500 [Pyrenophora tritici-repentis]KAG9385630.1 ECM11 domain containing protein [Pyrenophora tritici-repentis]